MRNIIYLFGYSKHGKYLAKALKEDGFRLRIATDKEEYVKRALSDGFKDVSLVNITDDNDLTSLKIKDGSTVVCVMEDEHLNVFLALSLRSIFGSIKIISVSSSIYMTQKLKMAGSDVVIDLYEVSANRIHNILTKPIATQMLDSFITKQGEISIREIKIESGSAVDGKMVDEIDFRSYNVILLGLVDLELTDKFTFITSGGRHKIDVQDILVCMGKEEDLESFSKYVGGSG